MPVVVHRNTLLACQDPHVMTTVSTYIHPFSRSEAAEEIDMPEEMPRTVDDKKGAIREEVQSVREGAQGFPVSSMSAVGPDR